MHRIFGFLHFGVYPAVLQLQLHLPGMQSVPYEESENLEDVVRRPGSDMTTLTEYAGSSIQRCSKEGSKTIDRLDELYMQTLPKGRDTS